MGLKTTHLLPPAAGSAVLGRLDGGAGAGRTRADWGSYKSVAKPPVGPRPMRETRLIGED